jgi:hypothetical protein
VQRRIMLSAFNVVGEPRLHEEASIVSFDPIAPPSPTRLIYPTLAQRLTPADVHQLFSPSYEPRWQRERAVFSDSTPGLLIGYRFLSVPLASSLRCTHMSTWCRRPPRSSSSFTFRRNRIMWGERSRCANFRMICCTWSARRLPSPLRVPDASSLFVPEGLCRVVRRIYAANLLGSNRSYSFLTTA